MSTDIELLREAARLMRERAKAASDGPWIAHPDGLVWPPRIGDPVSGSTEVEDAEHIASWQPAVALAVADWLESEATLHAELAAANAGVRVATGERWHLRLEASTLPQAVAVARAYLGVKS